MYLEVTKPGHLFVCFLCYCKYMGVHVSHVLPVVGIDDVSFINRQALIRIDGNQDNSLIPQGEKLSVKQHKHMFYLKRIQINVECSIHAIHFNVCSFKNSLC